ALHADLGYQSHAVPHGHKALDGLKRGKSDIHVQWSLVLLKRSNDFLPIWRGDVVRHKRFRAKLPDADLLRSRKWMARRNHEDQLVDVNDYGVQQRFLRIVAQHPKFRAVPQHFAGNLAA